MIRSLIVSLILTLIIELTVSLILGIREKNDIKVVIFANLFTNPIVVYISNCILYFKLFNIYSIVVAILEIFALVAEFIIYKKYLRFDRICAFKISLINNVISFGTGVIINIIK